MVELLFEGRGGVLEKVFSLIVDARGYLGESVRFEIDETVCASSKNPIWSDM